MSGINTTEVEPDPIKDVVREVIIGLRNEAISFREDAAQYRTKADKEAARALELTQMAAANEAAADLIERTTK